MVVKWVSDWLAMRQSISRQRNWLLKNGMMNNPEWLVNEGLENRIYVQE